MGLRAGLSSRKHLSTVVMSPVILVLSAFSFADQLSHEFLANLGKSFLLNPVYSLRLLFECTFLLAECLHDISRWFTCHRCHRQTLLESPWTLAAKSLALNVSSCRQELLQWLLQEAYPSTTLLPLAFRSPSPITGLFLQDGYSTFSSSLIIQLYINSEQFGGMGSAAQIFQFPSHSAGEYHR